MQVTLLIRDRTKFTVGRSVHDEKPECKRFGVLTIIGWAPRPGDAPGDPWPHDSVAIYFDKATDLDGVIEELHALRNDLAAAEAGGAAPADFMPPARQFWPTHQPWPRKPQPPGPSDQFHDGQDPPVLAATTTGRPPVDASNNQF